MHSIEDGKYAVIPGHRAHFEDSQNQALALVEIVEPFGYVEQLTDVEGYTFNQYKWEDQYHRKMMVLDTDYHSFLVTYTCYDNAYYLDEHDKLVDPSDVFMESFIDRAKKGLPEPSDKYKPENFDDLERVNVVHTHQPMVEIYARPDDRDDPQYKPFDKEKLATLKKAISTTYLADLITAEDMDNDFADQLHFEHCDYNPYARWAEKLRIMEEEARKRAEEF